jgi:hypothetical protein
MPFRKLASGPGEILLRKTPEQHSAFAYGLLALAGIFHAFRASSTHPALSGTPLKRGLRLREFEFPSMMRDGAPCQP